MKRGLAICLAFLSLLCLLPGCRKKAEPQTATLFAMDTVMEFTVYGDAEVLARAEAIVRETEAKLSVTDAESELSEWNRGERDSLSFETVSMLRRALAFCERTDGALDITVYPLVRAWGFTTGQYRVPTEKERSELLSLVDYRTISVDGSTVCKGIEGTEMDFGAITKGELGNRLVRMLRESGVQSALLNLGGNVIALGKKPDGSPWRVAIADPDGNGYAGILQVEDASVVTSGGYERNFTENGVIYHHILDPATGFPAESGLLSVTIVGADGLLCDAMSTACFVMGLDGSIEQWRAYRDFEAIFLTDKGGIYLTEGLESSFTALDRYADAKVTVIRA